MARRLLELLQSCHSCSAAHLPLLALACHARPRQPPAERHTQMRQPIQAIALGFMLASMQEMTLQHPRRMATATITGYCSTVNAHTGGVGSAVVRAPDTTTCSQHAQCCRVVTTGSWILRLSKTCSLQSMIVNLPLGQAAATVPVAPAVRAPAQKLMPTAGWHGAACLRPGATVRTAAQMQRLADTVNGRCCWYRQQQPVDHLDDGIAGQQIRLRNVRWRRARQLAAEGDLHASLNLGEFPNHSAAASCHIRKARAMVACARW